MPETTNPRYIESRYLSKGMVIINEDEHTDQDGEITVLEVKTLKGTDKKLDQIMYRCIYGWGYLYCSQKIQVKHIH